MLVNLKVKCPSGPSNTRLLTKKDRVKKAKKKLLQTKQLFNMTNFFYQRFS